MLRRTGVARKVDQLGRVVLPSEVRRHFDISPGDLIEIAVDSDAILLTKVENRCVFCGETASLSGRSSVFPSRISNRSSRTAVAAPPSPIFTYQTRGESPGAAARIAATVRMARAGSAAPRIEPT